LNEENRFEMKCGIVIAIFAAVMAVSDMFAGKYGEDEIKYINEKSSSYMWYQAKSIRETVVEGQRDLINTLVEGQLVKGEMVEKLNKHNQILSQDVLKYKKEKKEILLGSNKVGKENWAQDIDGKLGQVTGALEYQEKIEILGKAGDQFDFSNLFFQMCLVMGAISLVLKKEKLQTIFFYVMVSLGSIASVFSIIAYSIASKA
jgi:hypothetical protein